MCFTINKYNPKALTSDHDIPCLKILLSRNGHIESPSQNHYYSIGELQNIVKLIPEDHPLKDRPPIIEEGYHSFISIERLKDSWLYSYVSLALHLHGPTIWECVIPKGYQYYVNYETGEYVSESIILKRIYESNESSSNRPSEE
jgi:hypothetical protein